MRRPKPSLPIALSALALTLLAPAAHAAGSGFLNDIQNQFQSATSGWMSQALVYAKHLFLSLAVIEFVWWGITRALRGGEIHDLVTGAMLKIMSIGFFLSLLVEAPTWIPALIDSFTQAGQAVGASGSYGVTSLNPSAVFAQGFDIASAMYTVLGNQSYGMTQIASAVSADITVLIAALLAIVAFGIIALQLLITTVESYIVIGGGALMLGFGGSRWTLPFAEKYIGYAVSVGVKLFILYLIVGLATHIGQQLTAAINATSSSSFSPLQYLQMGAGSIIVAGLAWMVPSLAGSLMNGSPSMSVGALGGAAAGIVGGGIAGGAAGAATALKTANTTIGAAKFGGSLGTLARTGGLGLAAAGAGSALGSAARDAFHGIGARRGQDIASALGAKAVQGMGEGTAGGGLANRVRAFGGTAGNGKSAGLGNAIEGSGGRTVGTGVASKGAKDGFSGGGSAASMGARLDPRDADPNRAQAALDGAARQRSHMPHQGHAGGIAIRLGHHTD
jgi:type IV secretion system protein TrbL